MAFDPSNLSFLVKSNDHTQWHYRTAFDEPAKVLAPGYFDGARESPNGFEGPTAESMFRPGDLITISASGKHGQAFVVVCSSAKYTSRRHAVTLKAYGEFV